ncbi:MAG: outer membrane protein assembly factor BamA [Alphaproteobacteria bacterium]|nr:outer membrane protein assembly factor BamA [Alphaproteobacteria bacterium]MBV8412669.1 outer membrane protein assembly factor BamA [Alphaproteobacteria bacterium]
MAFGGTAQAQRGTPGATAAGGVITAVQIQGNVRAEPETIRSYLQLKEGQTFDAAAADRSLKALFATGLFSDVSIDMQGSTLVVRVTENPIINRVAFEGNSKIDDDKLRDEIQSKPRQVFTRARVQSDVERILSIYRRSGRYNASVEPKIIKLEQGRVDLVFEINEGDVTGVQRISFVGNEHFSDGTLRGKIRTTESAWWRFLSSDDRYDPDRLNLDRELLRKFYLSEGYADFRVISAVAELAPNRQGFFITFTISEGERYKFGKVDVSTRFQGLDIDVLKSYLTMAEGDWYDAGEVEKTVAALTDVVGSLGYAFVEVRPNIRRNKDNLTIDVTFDIQEGPRVYVERINISGNTRTLDKVIRREFRLAEGDAFSTAKVRRSQERLRNLGFFEKVDIAPTPGSTPDKTNLEVQVVEQSTGDISFGAGFSTTSGILGDISLKERNLLGKGQELQLGASVGTLSTLVNLSFTEPYFLDRPMSAGFDLFLTQNDRQAVASYNDASIGFALRAGWAYTEHTRQAIRYTLRQTNIYNVQPWASYVVQANAGLSLVNEFAETVSWDTRDTRLNTTKGILVRNTVALATAPGTQQYFRTTADAVYYRQIVEDFVASIGGSVGAIIPYNGTSLTLNNLFFIGGDTLRGFAVGGIGPRDSNTGDALGGTYFYTGTTELSFPVGLPKELGILGKAFVDFGSLWGLGGIAQYSSTVLYSTTTRVSTGIGFSWVSPFGPIRIDYAWPVVQDPWDRTQNFRFSFGTRF